MFGPFKFKVPVGPPCVVDELKILKVLSTASCLNLLSLKLAETKVCGTPNPSNPVNSLSSASIDPKFGLEESAGI